MKSGTRYASDTPGGKNSDATATEKTCMRSNPDVTTYSDNDRFWINWWY